MIKVSDENGFTLLELIVSVAIIGIVLLGLFRVIDSTQRINTKNDRDIKALNILKSEIEQLRSQIKKKPDEDGDRSLFVEDEVSGQKIEIKFDKDTNEAIVPQYSKIDKATNSIYKIEDLRIRRKLITGNNKSVNKAFNDYEYTIDIETILEDSYFSKKITKINDIVILGNNLEKIDDEDDGGVTEPDKLSEYNIRIHGPANWESNNVEFKVAKNGAVIAGYYPDYSFTVDRKYNLENETINLNYIKKQGTTGIATLELKTSKDSIVAKSPDWLNLEYKDYSNVSIYIQHTGIEFKEIDINGAKYSNIGTDVNIPLQKSSDGSINIQIKGIKKINNGDITGPNADKRGDIFIRFS